MRRIAIVLMWIMAAPLAWPLPLLAQERMVRTARLSVESPTPLAQPSAQPASHPATSSPVPESSRAASDSLAVPLERASGGRAAAERGYFFGGPVATIAGALAITLGLFAVVVVVARRGGTLQARGLPREAFEIIGQTAIGPRQRLMVLRVGTQALVIGTSPAGIHPVAQFDDPDEAGQLISQCRAGMGAHAAFRATLSDMEREATPSGFVDHPPAKRGSLFLRA